MKADISRSTFRPTRHYSGVLLQQGRVQLDADFNEQADIGRHRDRLTTRDVVGPSGAPTTGGGFKLTAAVLLDAIGFANQDGVAVGERGTRLTTSDGGANWAAANSGTNVDLHALSLVDANNVWAVGSGATIRKGTVAGSWSAQSTPSGVKSELRGVQFRDANNGVAVGAGPVVLATADAGANWATQTVPAGVTEDLNAVHFPTAGTGFAVGDAGRILNFSGGSWKTQSGPLGFAANLRAVRFASAQKGWAVGDGGSILATTDGGTTWVEQEAPLGVTGALRALELDPANADAVWAAGDDGTLIRTADSGATWDRVTAPATVTADLRALAARPASAVAVVGDLSTLAEVASDGAWTVRTPPQTARDLAISAGRFYLDGVLCENDRALRYADQPDYPGAPDGAPGENLIYLDVWEGHVTALEDRSLREVALGGPDTATRTKTVWQVRIAGEGDIPDGGTCDSFPPDWVPPSQLSTGRLRARAEAEQIQTNECMVPLGGGYRRLENQLYRVEVHDAGTGGTATYKWSRDNGSAVARLEALDPKSQNDFSSGELTVSELGRDAIIGFAGAAFVELSDEGRVLRGEPGILLEVDTITGNTIKWKGYSGNDTFPLASFGALPTVRRWEGTATVTTGQWDQLEAGVFVEFDEGTFRSGDYWTIPARTRPGTVEWPDDDGTPVFQPRHGIEHRYAPLGFAQLANDGTWTVETDCRETFDPLTELAMLVYIGGGGQEAMPGDTLPRRLEVGVFRGRRPIEGAHIRFFATESGRLGSTPGTLGTPGSDLETSTGSDGIAGCFWQLEADPAKPSQMVTAELRDDLGNALGPVVHFNGNLSIAEQVAYAPDEGCADLQDANTVQTAIDALAHRPRLFHVTGDGAHAAPGQRVDLEVGVASDCGPDEQERHVQFVILDGDGNLLDTDEGGQVSTSGGHAKCGYSMGSADRHVVEAQLVREGDGTFEPPVFFTITRLEARDVGYVPGCDLLKRAEVDNVQDAITELCKRADHAPPSPLRLRLQRNTLTNVEDAAGLWQYEGGVLFDGDNRVAEYASHKRIVSGGVQNAAMLTMTIFFLGSSPPETVTVQGSHDFGSGNELGSVSAASPRFADFIGHGFGREGNNVMLG